MLGAGIWTVRFVATLGFGVAGTDIRYGVPLTVLSLLAAMADVGLGVLALAQGPDTRARSLLDGVLTTGIGVASTHCTGMYAATVDVAPSAQPLSGATAMRFVFPFPVGLGSYVILTAAFVALPRRPATKPRGAAASPADRGPVPPAPPPAPAATALASTVRMLESVS